MTIISEKPEHPTAVVFKRHTVTYCKRLDRWHVTGPIVASSYGRSLYEAMGIVDFYLAHPDLHAQPILESLEDIEQAACQHN